MIFERPSHDDSESVTEAASGTHGAFLFLVWTAFLVLLGQFVLGDHKPAWSDAKAISSVEPSLVPVVATLLAFLFVGAIALSNSRTSFYLLLVFGAALYGPLAAFIIFRDPNLYLVHICVSSVAFVLFASRHRDIQYSGWALAADCFLCLSISTLFWLSLGRFVPEPWSFLVEKANREGAVLLQAMTGGTELPTRISTLLSLRIASGAISLVAFAILAMARTIHAELPAVPPLPRLPRINGGGFILLRPIVVVFNAFSLALSRLASITWFFAALAAIYVCQFFYRLLLLVRERLFRSGVLLGFLRSLACYALWGGLMLVAGRLPSSVMHYIGSKDGYSRAAFGQFGASVGLCAVAITIIYLMVELQPALSASPAANMSYGITIVSLAIVFGSLALYTLSAFGFVSLAGTYRLGPFLVLCAAIVGVTVAGMLMINLFGQNSSAPRDS